MRVRKLDAELGPRGVQPDGTGVTVLRLQRAG